MELREFGIKQLGGKGLLGKEFLQFRVEGSAVIGSDNEEGRPVGPHKVAILPEGDLFRRRGGIRGRGDWRDRRRGGIGTGRLHHPGQEAGGVVELRLVDAGEQPTPSLELAAGVPEESRRPCLAAPLVINHLEQGVERGSIRVSVMPA